MNMAMFKLYLSFSNEEPNHIENHFDKNIIFMNIFIHSFPFQEDQYSLNMTFQSSY